MYIKKRKTSRGLIALFITAGVLTLLFVTFFLILAFLAEPLNDPDFCGLGVVIAYHADGLGKLLTFSYGSASNLHMLFYAFSALLYAFVAVWIVFLVTAGMLSESKKRQVMWIAVAIVLLSFAAYVVLVSGSIKYIQIITGESYYEGQTAVFAMVFALLASGIALLIVSLVAYFWSIVECYTNPGIDPSELEEQPSVSEEHHVSSPKKVLQAKKKKPMIIVQNFYDEDENPEETQAH